MKEVINYYWNSHSKVYVALIDTSKAFDRVRYERIFDLLYKRSIPPIILRTIMDMYESQERKHPGRMSMVITLAALMVSVKEESFLHRCSPNTFQVMDDSMMNNPRRLLIHAQ